MQWTKPTCFLHARSAGVDWFQMMISKANKIADNLQLGKGLILYVRCIFAKDSIFIYRGFLFGHDILKFQFPAVIRTNCVLNQLLSHFFAIGMSRLMLIRMISRKAVLLHLWNLWNSFVVSCWPSSLCRPGLVLRMAERHRSCRCVHRVPRLSTWPFLLSDLRHCHLSPQP